LETFFLANLLA